MVAACRGLAPTVTVPQVASGAELLGPREGTVYLIGRPHPLRMDVVEHHLPAGLSIAEMLEVAIPDRIARRFVNVTVGGEIVPDEWHGRLRPKPGTRVEFRARPRKDAIDSLLTIALIAVAAWAGPAGAALLGLATGTAGFGIASGLITAGVTIAGSLIINAIAPPPTPGRDALGSRARMESLPGIRGSQNRADPYGPIPLVLGRHLVVPLLGAEHYTEKQGDDQYLRSLFVVGYGPLAIRDIKIGDTPIEAFDDVEVEVRQGFANDKPIRLIPSTPFQTDLSIELKRSAGWQVRNTVPDVDEAFVDTVAPNGVGEMDDKGKWKHRRIVFQVMYRLVGKTAWADGGQIEYDERLPRTRRRSRRVKFPERGEYQVRIRRMTADAPPPGTDDSPIQVLDTVVWSALRSMRNDRPIQSDLPLALIAVRIKATDQLNGVIDDLSCVATSIVPNFNGSSWVNEETRNPASLYRWLLRGPHLKRAIPLSRIDLQALQAWHQACRVNGWRCDAVIQGQRTLFDALKDVAATGRAAFVMKDGLYSVKRDVPQTAPVQVLTPRNIMGLNAERVYPEMPDALRVQFVSAAAGWQQDELVVYADGHSAATAKAFDTLDLWGITNVEHVFRDARYHMAVAKLRPERLTVSMDMEYLVARPGDMVRVAHDVMLVGLAQARIVSRQMWDGQCIGITVDEDCPMQGNREYSVRIRRAAGGQSEVARQVVTVAGINRTLTFVTPIDNPLMPRVDDVVAFGETGRVSEEWVVNGIEPAEGMQATLTLVPHAPQVHTADEGPIPEYNPRTTLPISLRRPRPPTIADVLAGGSALERLPNGDLMPRIIATLQWSDGPLQPPIVRVEAQVRRSSGGRWDGENVTVEDMRRVVVREVTAGERYDLRVRLIGENGRSSRWTEQRAINVVGAEARPKEVRGLIIESTGGVATLSWRQPADIDVDYYQVRHSRLISGATWPAAVNVVRVPAPATSVEVPFKVGTYLVKPFDHRGRTSITATAITTTVPRVAGLNFVEDIEAHPSFAGPKDNTVVDMTLGGLRLERTEAVETIAEVQEDIDILVQADAPLVMQRTSPAFSSVGTWDAAAPIDLGAVFTSRVTSELSIVAASLADNVYDWPDVYAIEDVYGEVEDGVMARAMIQTTDDNPADAEWSDWRQFEAGDYTARAYRFRLQLESNQAAASPIVTSARFVVDMPDRVYSTTGVTVSNGVTIPFDPPFFAVPEVGITIRGGSSGDRVEYDVSADSIIVETFASGGGFVARTVEILARGYGERE